MGVQPDPEAPRARRPRQARHATVDDVARLATSLAGVTEVTTWKNRAWSVNGRAFVWVRPFSKADVKRLVAAGETVPDGPIIAVRLEDMGEKEAELAEARPGVFDIEHMATYPAVLVQLDVASPATVDELVRMAWTAAAERPGRRR